ncbi:hypothetical protein PARHAE_03342 [Paracoccus haematequi]|uniref:SPW repeat-containing integral membrane domain-containing protein n=1 Tax=Paracoccus haematequi TaxID=2491866 RepID=A0A447IRJ9_9RHOB|nr:hypothetical protein [Paracoccus haematequi]VDS10129.1 hypothetical protein PARHAE_03342 [Paracoccus haematequi]
MIANWISDRRDIGYRIAAGAAIVAGLLMAALPLMLSLPPAAFWNSLVTGAAIVALTVWLVLTGHPIADRLLLVAGLWVALSPWTTAAGYAAWLAALHVIGGLALVVWTGARIWSASGSGGPRTA